MLSRIDFITCVCSVRACCLSVNFQRQPTLVYLRLFNMQYTVIVAIFCIWCVCVCAIASFASRSYVLRFFIQNTFHGIRNMCYARFMCPMKIALLFGLCVQVLSLLFELEWLGCPSKFVTIWNEIFFLLTIIIADIEMYFIASTAFFYCRCCTCIIEARAYKRNV